MTDTQPKTLEQLKDEMDAANLAATPTPPSQREL